MTAGDIIRRATHPDGDTPARSAAETASDRVDTSGRAGAASTGQLMSDLSDQLSRLVRDEMELARLDLKKSARYAGLGAGLFGAAGVLALFGLAGLIATAMIALALILPGWLAALIVSAAVLVVAAVLALVGRGQARKAPEPANQVMQSLKADVTAVKEEIGHDHTQRR